MARESMSLVTSVPTNRKPRTKIDFGIIDHLSSSQHGRLTPNFIKPIFPGDTFNMRDFAGFAYADKSAKLPLQDIIYDQYFFFVPFRVIDRANWDKVLGARDNPYDKQIYGVPQFLFTIANAEDNAAASSFSGDTILESMYKVCPLLLPTFLGNTLPDYDVDENDAFLSDQELSGSAYPLMAYWCVFNDFFRDENLDSSIDAVTALNSLSDDASLFELIDNATSYSQLISNLESLHIIPERVNKLHDPLTSGMITPQKSPDGKPVALHLGGVVPVLGLNHDNLKPFGGVSVDVLQTETSGGNRTLGKVFGEVEDPQEGDPTRLDFYTDLSPASFDINALRLAFAIQSLYEAKGRFGSRYIEYIQGIWGVSVPDSMLDRPEYLGGVRLSFNNMPVLNTASNLGLFSGYSATLFNGCQFDKTFLEYGYIIGVHCERVRHTYPQGVDLDVWDKKVELDFYNPKFAELGFMGYKKALMYAGNESIFNYNEAWTYERAQLPRASGIFGPLGGSIYQEYREKWTYCDYYDEAPTFNSTWLKEPTENVARTMTGELITNAPNSVYGFQYMFDFKFRYTITRIIPVYSTPAELGGRW